MEAERQARWTPSPRAQRRACHRRERGISAFTRVFDALWERVGVRGAFVGCPLHPSPRRHSASKTRVNALAAATLSHKGPTRGEGTEHAACESPLIALETRCS